MQKTYFYTLAALLILLSSTTANARRYYFTVNGAGALTGTSWTTAMAGTSLRTTLASAVAGDDFWIAKGTYKPTNTSDRTLSFQVPSGVKVYGGFAGSEVVLGTRNNALLYTTNATILSGEVGATTTTTDNSYHVVVLANCNANTLLNGLVITAGNGSGTYPENSGGGIYAYGNSNTAVFEPWVQKTWIHDNFALYGGGTATNDFNGLAGVVRFFDCKISSNAATYGGGCHIQNGNSAYFESVTFDNNGAVSGGSGGAILITDSEQRNFIYNCEFTNNTATNGGAVHNGSYTLKCDTDYINCLFAGNYAIDGGAIYNASQGGGGNGVRTYVTNCCFQGNRATSNGGAINSNVANTSSGGPNKVYVYTYNSTFGGNLAASGGAIYNDVDCFHAIKNSIIWGNSTVWSGTNVGLTMLRSIVQGGYTGVGNVNVNPLFVNPQTPGQSILGDYRLSAGSPGIDSGLNTHLPLDTYDLDGDGNTTEYIPYDWEVNARVFNTTVDKGAYEYNVVATDNDRSPLAENTLLLFPNPTQNEFRVAESGQLAILDITGKCIKTIDNYTENTPIHLTANGIFFVKLINSTEKTVKTGRIVVLD